MAKARRITRRNITKGMTVLDAAIDKEVYIMEDISIKNGKYCTWGVTEPPGAVTIDYSWDEEYPEEAPELIEVLPKVKK